MILVIVATDINHGIAKNNQIPWHLKKDLTFFKETTSKAPKNKTNVIIMGRKTHEAMGQRVLPNRINIVITSNPDYYVPGVITYPSLEQAVKDAQTYSVVHNIYIIGGQQIYEEALKKLPVEYIYKTVLYNHYDCDRFFPPIDHLFELVSCSVTESEADISYHIEVWRRTMPLRV